MSRIRRTWRRLLRCEQLERRNLLAITVDTLIDDADGSIDDGDVSLRDAIAAASPGETIRFDPALNGGTIRMMLGEFEITSSLAIAGPGLDQLTIHGNNSSGIFSIDDGERFSPSFVRLSGFTITGAHAPGRAAVDSAEGLSLENMNIIDNTGTGVAVGNPSAHRFGGDLSISNSLISGNSESGVSAFAYGSLSIRNSVVSDNGAWGMHLRIDGYDAPMNIQATTVSGNAGGIRAFVGAGTSLGISDSHITGNLVQGGASINMCCGYPSTSAEIERSVISNNHSDDDGGGIRVTASGSDFRISDSTITGNSTPGHGGGIFARGQLTSEYDLEEEYYDDFSASIRIENTTVSGNVAGESGGGVGLDLNGSSASLKNSTISGNIAAVAGGGIQSTTTAAVENRYGYDYSFPSDASFTHTTVTANHAGSQGGGFHLVELDSPADPANTIVSTVAAANSDEAQQSPDIHGRIDARFSLIGIDQGADVVNPASNLVGTLASPVDAMLGALAEKRRPHANACVAAREPGDRLWFTTPTP